MFIIAFIGLSIILLKWASNKNKEHLRNAKIRAKQERLHKQFLQAKKWAEEI